MYNRTHPTHSSPPSPEEMIRRVRSGGGYSMRRFNAGVRESDGLQLRGTGVWRDGDEDSEPSASLSLPQVSMLEPEEGRLRIGVGRGLCGFSVEQTGASL